MPTSALAFATTVHVAMVVLRKHRLPAGVFPWVVIPSLLFCASPWLFPSVRALATGLILHLAWFIACEKLTPARPPAADGSHAAVRVSLAGAVWPGRQTGAAISAESSKEFVPVPVLAAIDESPSIRTFRLARPESFAFQAGQFLTVCVQVEGEPHVRCYSISSAPEATGYLEISVKRQGLVSGTLHATVRPGAHLLVKPPAGRFVYPARDDRPVVLVAGGVGITPLASMLRHAVVADPGRPVTLLYSARGSNELAFWDELAWLGSRHPQVRVFGTITEPSAGWTDRVGRIDEALIARCVPDAAHSVFLMCGPLEMIGTLRGVLLARGVPASQVRSEVFRAAAAIGATAPLVLGETGEENTAAPTGPTRLELVKSQRTVDIQGSQTLLDAAESVGAEIPTLCRAGVCGTCRTRLLSGEACCKSDSLDDGDRTAGFVLPCVTWAQSDCALEA